MKEIYQTNQDFITRNIAGEIVLVPVGQQSQKLNGMITFSETGALLWEKLSKGQTKSDLVRFLASEYQLSEEQADIDVSEFLEKAEASELIVRCEME